MKYFEAHYTNDKPIVLYDTIIKKPFLIVSTKKLASKYIFGKSGKIDLNASKIVYSLDRKKVIEKNDVGVPIALRYANDEFIDKLGDNEYLFLEDENNYKKITFDTLKSIDISRTMLARDHHPKNKEYKNWLSRDRDKFKLTKKVEKSSLELIQDIVNDDESPFYPLTFKEKKESDLKLSNYNDLWKKYPDYYKMPSRYRRTRDLDKDVDEYVVEYIFNNEDKYAYVFCGEDNSIGLIIYASDKFNLFR